jgi:iron complex transport system substrate-binding protein
MKQQFLSKVLLLIVVLSLVSACAPTAQPAGEVPAAANPPANTALTVTDMLGRSVTLPAAAKRVVAIGPGALRLYVYAGNLDYVVGVEQMETGEATGKPYMIANPALAKLPVIGQGGPNNAPDPEKLLTVTPDVIFSTYAADAADADELQTKTGIPVVVISYGGFGSTSIFGEKVQNSLKLIGQVTGDPTKAQAAIDFITKARQDLEQRTKDIPDADKPTVYVGGLGAKGAHGIESTQGHYALLDVIHAKNVVDETGKSGSVMIDKEKLLEWDPNFLFVDQGGYAAVKEDYQKNPAFYEALTAVKEGKVYSQLPYNFYSTNLDTAIADAYFLGKTIYPAAFADVDPAHKADEIYQALLGQPLYAQMVKSYGEFGSLKLSDR